jgi:hypothetical protein
MQRHEAYWIAKTALSNAIGVKFQLQSNPKDYQLKNFSLAVSRLIFHKPVVT